MALFDLAAATYDTWYETEIGKTADQVERAEAIGLFLPPGPKVLEVGCGTGQYTLWLAAGGYTVTAVDASGKMLDRAREKIAAGGRQVEWMQGDIAQIMPQLDHYHGIMAMSVFEFLPDPERLLQSLFTHLLPGGCLVIGVIAGNSAWSEFYENTARNNPGSVFDRANFYTEREIRSWRVGGRLEVGKALYFPPSAANAREALLQEGQKSGNPGYLLAKWVKE